MKVISKNDEWTYANTSNLFQNLEIPKLVELMTTGGFSKNEYSLKGLFSTIIHCSSLAKKRLYAVCNNTFSVADEKKLNIFSLS